MNAINELGTVNREKRASTYEREESEKNQIV